MSYVATAASTYRVHTIDSSSTVEEARRAMLRLGVTWLAVSERGTVIGTVDQEQLDGSGSKGDAPLTRVLRAG